MISCNNVFASNVIINPGNFDYYENGNTRFNGKDSCITLISKESDVTLKNNFFSRNLNDAGFVSLIPEMPLDFMPISGSVLVNSADPKSEVAFDFSGQPRPIGQFSDIGAWEYNSTNSNPKEYTNSESQTQLLGNPVDEFLTIRVQKELTQRISLEIYNLNGQQIEYLGKSVIRIENHVIRADISSVPSGLYFFRLNFGNTSESGKFAKK
jgi:hypothetical protein